MSLIVDASVAISWHVSRNDPGEAGIAQQAIHAVMSRGALVPVLWFVEVTNALLTAERRHVSNQHSIAYFFADLDALPIATDNSTSRELRPKVLSLSRKHALTAYNATYLELALRTASTLATFDRKLAEAARIAGVPVFGDTP